MWCSNVNSPRTKQLIKQACRNNAGRFFVAVHVSVIVKIFHFPDRALFSAIVEYICIFNKILSTSKLTVILHPCQGRRWKRLWSRATFPLIVVHSKLQPFKNNKLNNIWIIMFFSRVKIRAFFIGDDPRAGICNVKFVQAVTFDTKGSSGIFIRRYVCDCLKNVTTKLRP